MLSSFLEKFEKMDKTIFFIIIFLIFAGVIFVYSASYFAGIQFAGNPYYFSIRQIFWAAASFIVFIVFIGVDYVVLKKAVKPLVLVTVVLLLLVFVPGVGMDSGGARRWINFRLFSFNPSELAKLTVIIYLSYIFTKKQGRLENFTFGLLPPLLLVSGIFFIILMQSGFSTAALLLFIALVLFFAGGASVRHILYIFVVSLPVLVAFVLLVAYRKARILSFLNPWEDPTGRGYHLIQSLKAFANGGFFGLGLGSSIQKTGYLPAPHTDFIFSIITEEVGLIGAAVLIGAFLLFFLRGVVVARNCGDRFGQLLAFGIVIMITIHAVWNMGIATGMLPPTGVSLPFISYGGSSMLVMSMGAGILLNISAHTRKNEKLSLGEIDDMVQKGFE